MNHQELQRWGCPRLILVATNLADRPALTLQAISQARRAGARILLVHVLRPASLRTSLEPMPDSLITSSRVAAAWDVIHRASKLIEWQGIPCEPFVVQGDPAQEISRLVTTRDADRVLVATRGAHGLSRLIKGSVAEALMTSVSVPVCVIGPRVSASPFLDSPGGRVVLALSLRRAPPVYLRFASELARNRAAQLVIFHFIDAAGLNRAQASDLRHTAQEKLLQTITASGLITSDGEIVVHESDPAEGILEAVVCPSRDLIVMGASSLSTVLFVSSTVHRVIADAQCPVITVRASESAGEEVGDAGSEELASDQAEAGCLTVRNHF